MSERSVRRALPADAEGFVRAHEASWDATIGAIVGRSLGELAPFPERVARFRAGVEEPPPHTGAWVAERDGEIVGIAVRAGAELRDLYVVPEAWGRGVAKELMEATLADIRADDFAEALLWVGEENARARRFYEREGWTQSKQTRASVLGPSEVQYRLDLTN
jgi:GNAT superfamily N-acetyltransferase